MQKEISKRPEEKKKNYELRFVINVLTLAIFFVADLYVMINASDNIPALIIVTILFLASIYLTLDTVSRSSQEKKSQSDEVYEQILKSEKASYLLLKKSFEEMSSVLEMTDVKSEGATEEIINAQKALAKVIISREKENADALMNSNDDVVAKVAFMESAIAELKPAILEEQQTQIKAANDEVVLKVERLFIELNNMEASMKDGLNEVSTKLSGFQEEIEKMADTLATMVTSMAEQAAAVSATKAMAETTSKAQAEEILTAQTPTEAVPEMPMEEIAIEQVASVEEISIEQITPVEDITLQTEIQPEAVLESEPIMESVDSVMDELPNMTEESAASIVESMMSAGMTGEEDEIKLEEILSIDDIVNSITEEASSLNINNEDTEESSIDSIIAALDSDSGLDGIENLDADINLEGTDSGLNLDEINLDDINVDNIESLDGGINLDDINVDNIESLDGGINLDDINVDNIESLDGGINLDDINVDNIESLDGSINLDDINVDNIESLDSGINLDDINVDTIEGLNTDISLDNLDSGLNMEGLESLDEINLDNIGGLDSDISLDSIEGLDSEMNLDSIEGLDSDISLDSIKGLDSDLSLDSIEGLDSEMNLDSIEGLDSDISLDNLNMDINLDNMETVDADLNMKEDTSLEDILKLAEEPVPEEKPSVPDSNPNKILTPEEIAALVAGASEPETEKEEIVEEISVEEEKPSMPDLSNPNKIMTPEEIAALLANM